MSMLLPESNRTNNALAATILLQSKNGDNYRSP